MFTQIHYPRAMSGETLDQYLEQGWFRMGQMIFTCQFLCFHGALYTALWVRLSLMEFKFRRGQRKLMNHNGRKFRILIREAVFDKEKEALYQVHKKRFEGYIAGSLVESLFGESSRDIYNTWEICIYDGEQLIGASFFDVGDETIASIMGLFDPEYRSDSLGYYTMLLEIEWAKQMSKVFYYPGYVVPGYGRFDYKLRIGEVTYFNIFKKDWYEYNDLSEGDLISEILKEKLYTLRSELEKYSIHSEVILYPLYDRNLVGEDQENFVHYPMFLSCYHHKSNNRFLIIEYDLHDKLFRISRARKYEDSLSYLSYIIFEGYDERTSFLEFLIKEENLLETNALPKLIAAIEKHDNVIRGNSF